MRGRGSLDMILGLGRRVEVLKIITITKYKEMEIEKLILKQVFVVFADDLIKNNIVGDKAMSEEAFINAINYITLDMKQNPSNTINDLKEKIEQCKLIIKQNTKIIKQNTKIIKKLESGFKGNTGYNKTYKN